MMAGIGLLGELGPAPLQHGQSRQQLSFLAWAQASGVIMAGQQADRRASRLSW